jgi:hypothetical protein
MGRRRSVVPLSQTHVALPTADAAFQVIYNVLTATRREKQGCPRAALAVDVPTSSWPAKSSRWPARWPNATAPSRCW